MYEAQVISVNPGVKTLGELHHPYQYTESEVAVSSADSESRAHPSLLTLSKGDLRRPAVATTVIRLVAATLLIVSTILTANILAIASGVVLAAMLAGGVFYRCSLIAAELLTFCCFGLLLSAGSALAALVLLGAFTLLTVLALSAGPGRFSIDALLAARR